MDIKQLEADFQNYIDSCNKLRNSASAIWKAEMVEDPKETNNFPIEYALARSRYLDNLGNIAGCARSLRDGAITISMNRSIQQVKEHLSVTAK